MLAESLFGRSSPFALCIRCKVNGSRRRSLSLRSSAVPSISNSDRTAFLFDDRLDRRGNRLARLLVLVDFGARFAWPRFRLIDCGRTSFVAIVCVAAARRRRLNL